MLTYLYIKTQAYFSILNIILLSLSQMSYINMLIHLQPHQKYALARGSGILDFTRSYAFPSGSEFSSADSCICIIFHFHFR